MQTKICTKCGLEKPLTDEYFNKSKNYDDGFTYYCKICIKEYKKQYYKKNKDKIKSKVKQYNKDNKEKIVKYRKNYRHKNKDKLTKYYEQYQMENFNYISKYKKMWQKKNKERLQEKNKQWYINNKEKILEKVKEYALNNKNKRNQYSKKYYIINKEKHKKIVRKYYENNKDKISVYNSQWKKENKDKVNISTQKRYARKHNLLDNFSIKQWEICKKYFNDTCCYCGKNEKLTQDHFIPLSKGGEYTVNNIVPACRSCNSSKHIKLFNKWYPLQLFYDKQKENKILKYLNYKNRI